MWIYQRIGVSWEMAWMCLVTSNVRGTIIWGNWCIVMFIYALAVMCWWQYDVRSCMAREIAMKSWIRLWLSFLGNHGDWVWVFVASLVLLVFLCFVVLDCGFVCVLCMAMPLGLWCLYWFHGFLLGCFLSCLVCFECLGNWLGKRKVKGARRELRCTQQVI